MGIAPGFDFNGNTTREEGACILRSVIPAASIEPVESPSGFVHGTVETAREDAELLLTVESGQVCNVFISLFSSAGIS